MGTVVCSADVLVDVTLVVDHGFALSQNYPTTLPHSKRDGVWGKCKCWHVDKLVYNAYSRYNARFADF
jgi:hypothetical protein